jgi:hypothetical protein
LEALTAVQLNFNQDSFASGSFACKHISPRYDPRRAGVNKAPQSAGLRGRACGAAAGVRMLPGPRCVGKGRGGRPRRGCLASGSGENSVPLNLEERVVGEMLCRQSHILQSRSQDDDMELSDHSNGAGYRKFIASQNVSERSLGLSPALSWCHIFHTAFGWNW